MSEQDQSQANRNAPGGVTPADRRKLLATCVSAAVKGAEMIRSRAPHLDTVAWEEKSRADFVSAVDRLSEEAIAEMVSARHADARILGEELSPNVVTGSGLVFVADPLDGTTNFLHGYPWYAVSIAALVDGVPQAGAILNVPTGELFTAVAGAGARRSGQPISVSPIVQPLRSLIGTGFPFKHPEQVDRYICVLATIMRETAGIRRAGAAALDLADVACGRFEAFWELTLAPWDMAAGMLLIREAGGVVTDLSGTPATVDHGPIVAGNHEMHRWLLDRLAEATSH